MNHRRAFTLIELLAVIAIVGILVGILMPGVPAARNAIDRARTRVLFNQWVLACAQFRQEYGFIPSLGTDNRIATVDDSTAFVRMLSGRNPDGTAVIDPATLGGNARRLAFYSPTGGELTDGQLIDAFGNTEFGVMIDRDGDGWVRPVSDGVVPSVLAGHGAGPFVPDASVLPSGGVQADVIFFSAGAGRSADDVVVSWR